MTFSSNAVAVDIGMSATVLTSSLIGLDAYTVEVEADISPGLSAFLVVGLPDTAVQEARERVKSAMKHSGLNFPRTKVTINLAPADLKKAGTGYDLPIAISILTAQGEIRAMDPKQTLMLGELSLDGKLRSVPGALCSAILASHTGIQELIVPSANCREASLVPGVTVIPANTLKEVVDHVCGTKQLSSLPKRDLELENNDSDPYDMSAIRGQESAKRALEIAAAGGHNILMQGPPGSGKTLLARTFSGILPKLTVEEALEVTRIHSVAGLLPNQGYVSKRPFRAPHHTASGVALVGGGTIPRPGEVSLSHRGVLFLDEFPEFSRSVLENLRQPLEDGFVTVSRAQGTISFPARFLLVAAMNPCPCGFATDISHACSCTIQQIERYVKRISGPLLDRIDILIDVPKVPTEKLTELNPGEPSTLIRTRVQAARDRQFERYKPLKVLMNSELTSDQVRKNILPTDSAKTLLQTAIDKFKLSARAYFRVLKVSRTIADLEASETIEIAHIAEALQYRQIREIS